MQKMPSWDVLYEHYPALNAGQVFKRIGGKVELNYDIGVFSNACATRISSALNHSGEAHKIPFYRSSGPSGKVEAQVSSGSKKNWHIFRVQVLIKYLTQKYGAPEGYSPSNYKSEMKDRKGIIIFEVQGWSDATGHADLWDGNKCVYKGYGDLAHKVLFWEAS